MLPGRMNGKDISVSTQEYLDYKEEYQRQERENDKLM